MHFGCLKNYVFKFLQFWKNRLWDMSGNLSQRTCNHKKRNNDCIEPVFFSKAVQKMYLQTIFEFYFFKLIKVNFWLFEKLRFYIFAILKKKIMRYDQKTKKYPEICHTGRATIKNEIMIVLSQFFFQKPCKRCISRWFLIFIFPNWLGCIFGSLKNKIYHIKAHFFVK